MNTARQISNKHLLTDLGIVLVHHELRPVYRLATKERRGTGRSTSLHINDFATVSGNDNLAQAISIRLLTPRGELTALAHPDFGSRLHELIGRPNTDTTRNLARLYIIEALQREPRVAEISVLEINQVAGTRNQLSVLLQVLPVASRESISVEGITLIL